MAEHPDRDWFLREWMEHFGKRQAALNNELGWPKSRMNDVWHGRQRYNRDLVNELCEWLGIEPYELLMHPVDATMLKTLRASALAIAANQSDSNRT